MRRLSRTTLLSVLSMLVCSPALAEGPPPPPGWGQPRALPPANGDGQVTFKHGGNPVTLPLNKIEIDTSVKDMFIVSLTYVDPAQENRLELTFGSMPRLGKNDPRNITGFPGQDQGERPVPRRCQQEQVRPGGREGHRAGGVRHAVLHGPDRHERRDGRPGRDRREVRRQAQGAVAGPANGVEGPSAEGNRSRSRVGRRRRGRRGVPDLLGPRACEAAVERAGRGAMSFLRRLRGRPPLPGGALRGELRRDPAFARLPRGHELRPHGAVLACVRRGRRLPARLDGGAVHSGGRRGPVLLLPGRVRLGRGVPGRQPVRRGEPGLRDHLERHLHHRLVPALTRAVVRVLPRRRGRSSRRARPGFTVSGPPGGWPGPLPTKGARARPASPRDGSPRRTCCRGPGPSPRGRSPGRPGRPRPT